MKKEDEFIVTPDSFTQEQWCEMYIKVVECAQELKIETERLKELCDKYEEEHSNAFKLWTMKMEEMPCYEEFMDYKSRCEKAIEYIKKHLQIYDIDGSVGNFDEFEILAKPSVLLNILNGGDKE